MLRGVSNFSFNHRIIRGSAGVGRFAAGNADRSEPQLVVASDTNKILVQNSESVFHVPEAIICLAVFPLQTTSPSGIISKMDIVLVGTRSSVIAFDVFNNRTLFHRDMPEGVNCIRVGQLDAYEEPVLVCGCGTTVWGLHADGSDVFWTVLGDEVNALELCDIDGDGRNELLVGSNGVEIKVFKNTTFLTEYDEGEATVDLCAIRPATFAFVLLSGTFGVYGGGERYWRIKPKASLVSLLPFPDVEHVFCAWPNGTVEIHNAKSNEILCKQQLDGSGDIVGAALIPTSTSLHDLPITADGKQVALVYSNGRVNSFYFTTENTSANDTQNRIREYGQRKHNLLEELKTLELSRQAMDDSHDEQVAVNARLSYELELTADRGLCLRLSVSNNAPIKAVLLFAEGIFDTECYTIHPTGEECSQLSAYFSPTKDVATEIFIKVIVGHASESQLHVFHVNQMLPKFATFLRIPANTNFSELPQSIVEFNANMQIDRLNGWLSEKFLRLESDGEVERLADGSTAVLKFICTRNGAPLILQLKSSGVGTLHHNNIESAANILQSLCSHMKVKMLECRAYFPDVLQTVEETMALIEEKYAMIERLSSDWAERLNVVRECVVRAEDALNIKNVTMAKKFYVRMAMLNRELVGQQAIRLNAREELLDALKRLNITIEQFSRLRIGEPASNLIKECRKAIAEENMTILPKLLQFGI